MHEENPLYAAMEEMLKEETVVSVEREVVIETGVQGSEEGSQVSVSRTWV